MRLEMWRFSAVFAVAALSAGVASGAEYLHDFSYFGSWGTLGLLLAAGALTWLAGETAARCQVRGIASCADLFSGLWGPSAGPSAAFLLHVLILLFAGSVAAEAAQAVAEGTALSRGWAAILLCAAAWWLANRRLKHLAGAAVLFLLLAAGYVGMLYAEPRPIPVPILSYQLDSPWLWHSALFLGKHFMLSLVLLVPLSAAAESAAAARRGAWIGGGLVLLFAGAGHLAILAHWHDVHAAAAPFAVILDGTVPFSDVLYRVMITLQGLITLALYLHGLAEGTAERYQIRREPTVLLYALILLAFTLWTALAESLRAASHTAVACAGLLCLASIGWRRFRGRRSRRA